MPTYPSQGRVGSRLNAFRLGYYIEVKAWLDARSNIGRSGASRSDYYSKLNIVIDIGGIDFSGSIRYGTLRISEALNDQPDTAAFTLLPNLPAAPHVGDVVRIGLGTVENLEFGGRIVSIQHTREAARNPPFLQILCTDYMPDFDQRLVNYGWPAQSGSATILDLVQRFCQQNDPFTTFGVKPNLPSLQAFDVVNARPSDVVRRITTLANGGFYVGPGRDLHAWANGSETGYADPAPLSLALITLKSFAHLEDGAQARTTIVVEGPRTSAPIGMPASAGSGSTVNALDYGIPIADATMFRGETNFEARIGSQRVRVSRPTFAYDPALARQGVTAADVLPGSLSWVPITFTDGGAYWADLGEATVTWAKIGDQYGLIYNQGAAAGGLAVLVGAPGQYYAAIVNTIKAGTTVTKQDGFMYLQGEESIATVDSGAQPIRAQPVGCDVIGVLRQGTAHNYTWPQKNVEHLVSDGRYSYAGMAERAAQELADFDHVAITCEWDTDDPNARVGRKQVINLEDPDALSTSVVILTSEITFPVSNHAPMRHCTGGTVISANILDILLTAKD